YRVANGRAELTDFWAAVFNPSTLPRYTHTIASAWVCGAFLMTAIASWYFLKNRGNDVARASLKLGVIAALVSTILVFATGDRHAKQVARTQPAKFAAMEGLYSTAHGAPLILFSLPPSQQGRRDAPELMITNLTSFLAFGNFQAPVKGLEEFPQSDWPPVAATFLSFHNMVILGNLMLLAALAGVVQLVRKRLEHSRFVLRALFWIGIFVPTLAIQLGWMAAEAGRQPWIVYGVMRTSDGVSKVVIAPEVLTSIVLFGIIYALLGSIWVFLLRREVMHGPEGLPLANDEITESPRPLETAPVY
ncbi:MAG: cytochrome ubiquinol oxidase subunit I, partial [Thermoanaerobaculia bacterium]